MSLEAIGSTRTRRSVAATAVALVIAVGLLSAPAGVAQSPGEPAPAEPIVLNVREVKVPATRGAVLSRGFFVEASCTPSCLIVVKVRVPASAARQMGLSNRVIASAVAGAADDVPVGLRVKVRKGARDPLAGYEGGGNFQVQVTAQR